MNIGDLEKEEKMKAILKTSPAPGIVLEDISKPEPGMGEVLIKVEAASICGTDMHYYHWNQAGQGFAEKFNVKWPLVLGHECGGTIVKVGEGVTDRKVGDRVAVETHISCGRCFSCQNGMAHNCSDMAIYGTSTNGCFAEYALAPAKVTFVIPKEMSFEEAALLEPAGVAMRAVEEACVQPGDTVVVNGCGPIGLLAVLILKAGNAARVIATDLDDYRLNLAGELGAITVNPMKENAVEKIKMLTRDRGGADIALETSGAVPAYRTIFDFMRLEGRLITVGHPGGEVPIDIAGNVNTKGLSVKGIFGRRIWETWWNISSLISAGKINLTEVVTHRFTLDEGKQAFEQSAKGSGKILFVNK